MALLGHHHVHCTGLTVGPGWCHQGPPGLGCCGGPSCGRRPETRAVLPETHLLRVPGALSRPWPYSALILLPSPLPRARRMLFSHWLEWKDGPSFHRLPGLKAAACSLLAFPGAEEAQGEWAAAGESATGLAGVSGVNIVARPAVCGRGLSSLPAGLADPTHGRL